MKERADEQIDGWLHEQMHQWLY